MNKLFTLFLVLCLSVCFAQVATVSETVTDDRAYEPGELVAYVPQSVRSNDHETLLESWGYSTTREGVAFDKFNLKVYRAADRSAAKDVMEAVQVFNQSFSRSEGVLLLPNYIFKITSNDPLFNRKGQYQDRGGNKHDILLQWDMNNPGEFGGVPTASLHAQDAWKHITGNEKPVVVAVVDTGIDYEHVSLDGRFIKEGSKVIGSDFSRLWGHDFGDDHGHGSHCAGSIAAVYNDSIGMTGSAGPTNVKLIPVKALGKGGAGNMIAIGLAIKWSGEQKVDVISMSLGATPIIPEQEPILKEVFDGIFADTVLKGVIPVAAAGNNGKEIHAFPAFCDKVIAIGASDHQDKPAVFSNFGDWVDVMAPGVNIVSARSKYKGKYTDMYQDAGHEKAEYAIGETPDQAYADRPYFIASGTSMACPNAAGVVAMLLAVNPELRGNTEAVRQILIETSDNPGTFKIGEDGGRINANKAVLKAKAMK